jgi:hypothetical protein
MHAHRQSFVLLTRFGIGLLAVGLTAGLTAARPAPKVQDARPRASRIAPVPLPAAPGGLEQDDMSTDVRPKLDFAKLIPSARGKFQFPEPYGTEAYRLTLPSDCGGRDCVLSVGYSYWRNMNNSANSPTLLAMVTLSRDHGGVGPSLFELDKTTGVVTNRGPLFASSDPRSSAGGEGWYFSATQPTALYVSDTQQLTRYDVVTHVTTPVFNITGAAAVSAFGKDRTIKQIHSSNDDQVHSFTVGDANYVELGCGVYLEARHEFRFVPTLGKGFDECQIDKSGQWLLIKEQVDGRFGEDNRIINLADGTETVLLDEDGAGGHSDMGYGSMIAADNWNPDPGVYRYWRFDTHPLGPKTVVYRDPSWKVGSIDHVSWANATTAAPETQFACGSGANRTPGPRVNEITCFQLEGTLRSVVVAPVMTDLDAPGGGTDEYWKLPKGNLDVTGNYFIWASNLGGDRLDTFIVRIPVAKILRAHAVPR